MWPLSFRWRVPTPQSHRILPTVRLATAADAERLSGFAVEAFRDTYEPHNTPADMARYVAGAFTVEQQAVAIADTGGAVLLAEGVDDAGLVHLVGYAHLVSSAPPPGVGPAPVELKRLYVGRQWHGRGVAQELMDATLDAARKRGAQTLWLGVWERNARAIAFYAKYGFARVGELTFMLGEDVQCDWLMARPLEKAAIGR
jgi:diamine N-acetyltransferase